MDQKQTGRFIAERRRELGLTQKELAEKLGITDRAVSKWENGRCMPDLSLLRPLSAILKVGINDLLSGEIISERDYRRKSEENLISMADLNLLKSFQFGFLGFYVMAVSMLIYCIVKNVETSGVLALICCYSTFLFFQIPDNAGPYISDHNVCGGPGDCCQSYCIYRENVVT